MSTLAGMRDYEWTGPSPVGELTTGARLPARCWVPMLLIWATIALASWKSSPLLTSAVCYGIAIVAIMLETSNAPLLLLLTAYTPLMGLATWRPYVVVFGLALFAGLTKGQWDLRLAGIKHRVALLAMIFVCYCFMSIAITPNPGRGIHASMEHAEGLLFMLGILAFVSSRRDIRLALKMLALVAGAALIINVVHSIFREQMALTRMFQQIALLQRRLGEGKYVYSRGTIRLAQRIIWAGLEPNYWAGQLLFPLGVAVGLIGACKRLFAKAFWLVIALMILIGIIGTYSRSGFIAVVFMGMLFLLKKRTGSVLPLMIAIVVCALFLSASPFLLERIADIVTDVKVRGGSGRLGFWSLALQDWLSSGLMGKGIGSFFTLHLAAVHNTYLEILAEVGIIGFTLYVWILAIGVISWWKVGRFARRVGDNRLRWLADGGLIGTIGATAMAGTVTLSNAMYLWAAVALGVRMWESVRGEYETVDMEEVYQLRPVGFLRA